MSIETKRCAKCDELKPLSEFHRDQHAKDGLRSWCKTCANEHNYEYRKANREKLAEYKRKQYKADPAKYAERGRKYREANPEKVAEYGRKWREANPDYSREYYSANREKVAKYKRKYERNRRDEDIQYRLAHNLRRRLRYAIKGNVKAGSAVRDLGCSIEELKAYLESLFKPEMTWNNYGEWHIDHIEPLLSFDLTDREQLLEACHYTNLQPLWAKDNLRKNNK